MESRALAGHIGDLACRRAVPIFVGDPLTEVPSASQGGVWGRAKGEEFPMLLLLAIVLALAWVAGFGIFHVASAAVHVLIILAVISIVAHFVRGRRVV